MPDVLRLGAATLDLNAGTVTRSDGAVTLLRPQSLETLLVLVDRPNRVVSKDELIGAVWKGVAVTDDSLVQCVHEIRRGLGEEGRDLLRTIPRRGYMLIAPGLEPVALPDAPSIAVLPFDTAGDSPVASYVSVGLVGELITSLSKIPGLFVIAQNSSSAVEGDPRAVATALGVRYLVRGLIVKCGDRLRWTGWLIDGATAAPLWSGRFDGTAANVLDFQDGISELIVGAIQPSVRRAEIARARRKRPESLDAYDLYLRAIPHVVANTPADGELALRHLDAALALDPTYHPAHAYAAWCREQRFLRGGFNPEERRAALAHADVALGIHCSDPDAMSVAAFVRANLTRAYDEAALVLDRALALNPNSALAYGFSALIAAHSERIDRAVDHAMRALRLSPIDDPMSYHPYCALAIANLFADQHEDALRHATLAIRANPGFSVPYLYLVASEVRLGDVDAARGTARRLLQVRPDFSVGGFERTDLFPRAQTRRIADALHAAGLPP